MSESGRIFYKGLPQDDLHKTSVSQPRILSEGSKPPQREIRKDRVTSPTIILLLIIFAMCIGLGVVFGIRYIKLSSEKALLTQNLENTAGYNPLAKEAGLNGNKTLIDSDKNANFNDKQQTPKPVKGNGTPGNSKEENSNTGGMETSSQSTNTDNEDSTTLPNAEAPDGKTESVEKELSGQTTTTLSPQSNFYGDQSTVVPQEPVVTSTVKPTSGDVTDYAEVEGTTTDTPQGPKESPMSPSNSKTTDKPSTLADESTREPNGAVKEEEKSPADEKNIKGSSSHNATVINTETPAMNPTSTKTPPTNEPFTLSNQPKPKETEKTGETETNGKQGEKLSTNVSTATEEMTDKEGALHVIKALLANPSVQLIIGAAIVIMIGLTLIVIALACRLSKPRKIQRRRQGLVSHEVDNENIILLTEDASEDEFVQA